MKTLILLRHAKSGWDDNVARDFDRPLNAKGERAAETMGRWLRDQALRIDLIVASPAARVQETLVHFAAGLNRDIGPQWDRRLYLASAATLVDVVRELPADADRAMLVGHNPGLEDLVLSLIPDDCDSALRNLVLEKFPTASIAILTFDIADWHDVPGNTPHLVGFKRPRDLDPDLGPDPI